MADLNSIEYSFEEAISGLDISLFNKILSETTERDKVSLLALQNTARNNKKPYVYMEIGSYLGGTIQPYLLDTHCAKIYSIDKRATSQPDERFPGGYQYVGNTTKRMLGNLAQLTGDIEKVITFDADASEVDRNKIQLKPDICFIDGEHTNKKVVSDFYFCKSLIDRDGIIVFHDACVVARGLGEIVNSLKKNRIKFKIRYLKSYIAAIFFGKSIAASHRLSRYEVGWRKRLAQRLFLFLQKCRNRYPHLKAYKRYALLRSMFGFLMQLLRDKGL